MYDTYKKGKHNLLKTLIISISLLLYGCTNVSQEEILVQNKKLKTSNECALFDGSCVDEDEVVINFETYSHYDNKTDELVIDIHSYIFEPTSSQTKKDTFISLIKSYSNYDGEVVSDVDKRISLFLADNQSSETLLINLNNKIYTLNSSNSAGDIVDEIRLNKDEYKNLIDKKSFTYKVLMPKDDKRVFIGKVFNLEKNSTKIVSDIDDTIKISEVYISKEALLANTFLKPSKVAPKMLDLFKKLKEENPGCSFHYVSGSPKQLYPFLKNFIKTNGFDEGQLILKPFNFDLLSGDFYNFFDSDSTYNHKIKNISKIFEDFKNSKFILVGDSGEKDPEVYAYMYKKYKNQIKNIYIRNVTQESLDNERFKTLFGLYSKNVVLIEP